MKNLSIKISIVIAFCLLHIAIFSTSSKSQILSNNNYDSSYRLIDCCLNIDSNCCHQIYMLQSKHKESGATEKITDLEKLNLLMTFTDGEIQKINADISNLENILQKFQLLRTELKNKLESTK